MVMIVLDHYRLILIVIESALAETCFVAKNCNAYSSSQASNIQRDLLAE